MTSAQSIANKSRLRLVSFAMVLSILLCLQANGAVAPDVDPCPGATSWSRSHPTLAETTPRAEGAAESAIEDDDLFKELHARVDRDQALRRKWLAAPNDETLAQAVNEVDSANLTWMRKLISENGFPTAAQVGKEGVHLAWVLLQHADQDPQFQRELLPVLEQRYSAGELPANDLARFTDRVLLASGKPQRYGTQFDWFSGEFKLPEPGRLAEIDKERARLGLMPLSDYVCSIDRARKGGRSTAQVKR
jgi:hypothetical protein